MVFILNVTLLNSKKLSKYKCGFYLQGGLYSEVVFVYGLCTNNKNNVPNEQQSLAAVCKPSRHLHKASRFLKLSSLAPSVPIMIAKVFVTPIALFPFSRTDNTSSIPSQQVDSILLANNLPVDKIINIQGDTWTIRQITDKRLN